MIKATIFDADGMVIQAGERFSTRLVREFGISPDPVATFFKNEFQQCLIGEADLRDELTKRIVVWGWEGSVDDILAYWFSGESTTDNRIIEAIQKLRACGVRCYLGTNQEKYRTEYFKHEMGFATLFDGVFSSAYIGAKKPSQEFFGHILNALQPINKEEVFFWDDTRENVDVARDFGFQSALYTSYDDFTKTHTALYREEI